MVLGRLLPSFEGHCRRRQPPRPGQRGAGCHDSSLAPIATQRQPRRAWELSLLPVVRPPGRALTSVGAQWRGVPVGACLGPRATVGMLYDSITAKQRAATHGSDPAQRFMECGGIPAASSPAFPSWRQDG